MGKHYAFRKPYTQGLGSSYRQSKFVCVIAELTNTRWKWFVPHPTVATEARQCAASVQRVSRIATVQHVCVCKMAVVLDFVAVIRCPWLLTFDKVKTCRGARSG